MKYVVIIGDGMADHPIRELKGLTPLQSAFTPNMDRLAAGSILGMVRTIPKGMPPGSDVANLSILGYDPAKFYSGRAPLEAASIGVSLKKDDAVYRCNLVTLKYNRVKTRALMEDHSSGHISTKEADVLIKDINKNLGTDKIKFYTGVSYRHLMIWSKGITELECVPPHDILGKDIADYQPVGNGDDLLRQLMIDSVDILENHPINKKRIKQGKNPANSIWLWGQGRRPKIPTFKEKYSLKGSLVSAVDLTKGLGIYAGFEILKVPGITGYLDTNYKGKADAALKSLKKVDLVYVHVEAPDEAGHSGKYKDKVKAIEDFDKLVVGTIIKGMKNFEEYKILLMPDHATPIEIRTHTDEPIPFVIFDSKKKRVNANAGFNEDILKRKNLVVFEKGYKLMDFLIKGK
ncbi:MAG: cofactor-independent phosphoglycerate mutase [Nitrospirae bacterium GWC2_42_7]|nr:MAG: cofactor-independent phosphoglycerate mutase [Nitrospirae bacterium GWC2_42_7]